MGTSKNSEKQAALKTLQRRNNWKIVPLQLYTKTKSMFFYEHLIRQNADIQLAKKIEENAKFAYLDCLVTHDNNKLVCDALDSLMDEIKYCDNFFSINHYRRDLIRRNTFSYWTFRYEH